MISYHVHTNKFHDVIDISPKFGEHYVPNDSGLILENRNMVTRILQGSKYNMI